MTLGSWSVGWFGAVFAVLAVVGLVGNGLVLVAVLGDRRMRTPMNLLLVNLAVADAGNLLMGLPEWTQILALGRPGWIYPPWLCPLARGLSVAFLYASILTQLAVAVERFVVIAWPMRARALSTKRNTALAAAAVWAFALAYASPKLFCQRFVPGVAGGRPATCRSTMDKKTRDAFKSGEVLLFYFVPLFALLALYSRISWILWSSSAAGLQEGQSLPVPASDPRQASQGLLEQGKPEPAKKERRQSLAAELYAKLRPEKSEEPKSRKSESLRSRRDVVKMLVGCVVVYFASYSPIQGIFLSRAVLGMDARISLQLALVLNAATMASSAANPLLYTVFSSKFRAKFLSLLLCRSAETRPSNASMVTHSALPPSHRLSSIPSNASQAASPCPSAAHSQPRGQSFSGTIDPPPNHLSLPQRQSQRRIVFAQDSARRTNEPLLPK